MNSEKNPTGLKSIIYGLIVLFILIFLSGFLSEGAKLLLFLVFLYFVFGLVLIFLIFKSEIKSKLKRFILLTGFSALGFTFGLSYGIFGIWGYYSINDPIYISSVIASCTGFIIGVVGSLILLRNGGIPKEPSVIG